MKPLSYVLKAKIWTTALFWCVPLLTFRKGWFVALGMPALESMAFLRLLGAAYLALTVGYVLGWVELRKGRAPAQAVWVGMVTNGLASAILVCYGLRGDWNTWGMGARIYMWASALATFWFTVLLFCYRRVS